MTCDCHWTIEGDSKDTREVSTRVIRMKHVSYWHVWLKDTRWCVSSVSLQMCHRMTHASYLWKTPVRYRHVWPKDTRWHMSSVSLDMCHRMTNLSMCHRMILVSLICDMWIFLHVGLSRETNPLALALPSDTQRHTHLCQNRPCHVEQWSGMQERDLKRRKAGYRRDVSIVSTLRHSRSRGTQACAMIYNKQSSRRRQCLRKSAMVCVRERDI